MLNFKRVEIISKIIAKKFSYIGKKHECLLLDFILIIIVLEEDMKREFKEDELKIIITVGIKRLIFKRENKNHEIKSTSELFGNMVVIIYLKTKLDNMEFFLNHNSKPSSKSKRGVSI
jgi:hypothetical protein